MDAIILAGGRGTRMGNLTKSIPKPMLKAGKTPLIGFVLANFLACSQIDRIFIAGGYKHEVISKWLSGSSVSGIEIKVIDTGLDTNKVDRINQIIEQEGIDEAFFVAYGDDVFNIDIYQLISRFYALPYNHCLTTITEAEGIFGAVGVDMTKREAGGVVQITSFKEGVATKGWINIGYMILRPSMSLAFAGSESDLESGVLSTFCAQGRLHGFPYTGEWHSVNTQLDLLKVKERYG